MKPLGRWEIGLITLATVLDIAWLVVAPTLWEQIVASAILAVLVAVFVMEFRLRREVKRREAGVRDETLRLIASTRPLFLTHPRTSWPIVMNTPGTIPPKTSQEEQE